MAVLRRLQAVAVAAMLVGAAADASAFDLNGHWHLDAWAAGARPGSIATIVQVGDDVSITYDGVASPHLGTIDGNVLPLTLNGVPSHPSLLITSDSRLERSANIFPYGDVLLVLLTRCECYDGNTTSGDGCDARCQVETCYDCTAEPSTCSPQTNGTGCDDLRDCTTGSTCTAGVCGGGEPIPSCIDMTDRWLLLKEGGYEYQSEIFREVSLGIDNLFQRDGELRIPGLPPGSIDTTTGKIAITESGGVYSCSGTWPFDAQAAADGLSFDGRGWWLLEGHFCTSRHTVSLRGFRCGGGVVDPGPECLVDSCMQCSGDPSTCVPLPNATPCRHEDPCTMLATCQQGACVANVSDKCPACSVCDGSGGCKVAPRENCRKSSDPGTGRLKMRSREGAERSSMAWRWSEGEATSAFDLGHPDINSNLTMCLFSEATPEPQLVLKKWFGPFGSCTPALWPCGPMSWEHKPDGSMTYREKYWSTGLVNTSWKLNVGAAGKSSLQLRTNGYHVIDPFTSFATPLRAQVQIDGGTCFDLPIDEAGVSKNSNGRFGARGTP